MSRKRRTSWIVIAVIVIAALVAVPLVTFQREKARRRHQIGQLWMLIRFYYEPAHEGHYPSDLAQLKSLPEYSPFFERAIHEDNLMAPGIKGDEANPNTVALEEHSVDSRSGRWIHYTGGAIVYRQ